MGKRAPSAPDPYATAQAQGAMNAETARVQASLNRGNTYTPFGNVTNAPIGNDQWETRVTLSPDQQRIFEQGQTLSREGGQLALDMLPQARETLAQPFAVDDADARDRATAGIMSRLEPQFARDREALEGRLTAQGFRPGTEAYARAADELNRSITDARMQATTAGLQESRNAANFSNAQRAQRVNELGMLFGLGPGMQMPQQAQMAPAGVAPVDLMGMVNSNYQGAVNQYGANMGAVSQLGAAALAAYLKSDARVKTDIRRVGTLNNGLPVYLFRYIDGGPMQIGLMAQDVERVQPAAVIEVGGVKHVNYAMAAR